MDEEQLEAAFLARAAGRLAPTSLASYRRDLANFRRDQQAAGAWPGWEQLTAATVRAAFARYQAAGKSAATQRRMATSLRQFYRDLVSRGVVAKSPLVGFRPAPGKPAPAREPAMPYEDLVAMGEELVEDASREEAALVTLLIRTGLRSGEVAALRDADFDWSLDILLVRDRQGRARYLPVDERVHQRVVDYQSRRRPASREGTLFINQHGAPVNAGWVARTIRRVSAGRLTPSSIRQLVINHWVRTAGVARAAQLAGHRQLSAIAPYLRNESSNLRQNYQKYFYGGDHDDHN